METGLFVISTIVYAAVYFAAKLIARLALKQDKGALKPRIIAFGIMVAAAVAVCVWVRLNLVDEAMLATLSDFEGGRYVGNVVGAFAVPAAVAAVVVAFRIRRARKVLAAREKQLNRPSPQW